MRIIFYSVTIIIILGTGLIFQEKIISLFHKPTNASIQTNISKTPYLNSSEIEIMVSNLSVPWDFAFLPGDEIIITERTGSLIHIDKEGNRSIIKIPDTIPTGEGGLLGIALHPRFSENAFLYLYITSQGNNGLINRVVRYTFNSQKLEKPTTIIDNIPGARYHDGGRIAFGPEDGMLYVATGDAGEGENAQNITSLAGKILRINEDGSIPSDNPFGNEVYSYGHRNPQGLAWDSYGQLWSTEHGRSGFQSGFDELNKIESGGNYGWPDSEGGIALPNTIAPAIHSGSEITWAPASLVFVGEHFLWGGLRGEGIYVARQSEGEVRLLSPYFFRTFGRIRTVALGPDRYIYFTTSNTDGRGRVQIGDDKLYRIHSGALLQ